MRIILIPIIALVVSCNALHQRPDVEEIKHLHGMDEPGLITELGSPSYTDIITLQHGVFLPEFYIEIHNSYPLSDPETEGVEIKELRWDHSGFTDTVFMHKVDGKWTVLKSFRWKEGVVF